MHIVADRDIPYIRQLFGSLGDLTLYNGRQITADCLLRADVLVVRTVTRITESLLEGSGVRFVATATSGHDHVDTEYLRRRGIGFARAPGCNARSVAEYVLSSLFVVAEQRQVNLAEKYVGIIGCGFAGSAVLALLDTLGIRSRVYDPLLQNSGTNIRLHAFDEVIASDIITLHVPLTEQGAYPTRNMVDRQFLARLKPGAILLNTSRGEIADEQALMEFLDANPANSLVMDVWHNEPWINTSLLRRAAIATPHIAGYSTDAKIRGTWTVFKETCRFFGITCPVSVLPVPPAGRMNRIEMNGTDSDMDVVQAAVLAAYDVRADSAGLRQVLLLDEDARGDFFSGLRNNYPLRREFPALTVALAAQAGPLRRTLTGLGFNVE